MAHVVAMKSVDVRAADTAVVGQPLTVSVTLKNMGSGAAKKIKVTDAKDLTNLEMVKGSMDHEYASLGAGETVEYSYTVKPTAAGALSLSGAEVTCCGPPPTRLGWSCRREPPEVEAGGGASRLERAPGCSRWWRGRRTTGRWPRSCSARRT